MSQSAKEIISAQTAMMRAASGMEILDKTVPSITAICLIRLNMIVSTVRS